MSATKILTFVKRRQTMYPKGSEDYEILRALGYPAYFVSKDFLILLTSKLKASKVKVRVESFEDLETRMLSKVHAQWDHPLTKATTSLTLHCPKGPESERLESLCVVLRKWYTKHHLKVEEAKKTSSKTVKVVLSLQDTI